MLNNTATEAKYNVTTPISSSIGDSSTNTFEMKKYNYFKVDGKTIW